MRYIIGYNSKIHKYVLMDYEFNFIAEFEFARDVFQFCEEHGYDYTIL